MREKFKELTMRPANKKRLEAVNSIIREYQAAGYKLTLRQLYYQLVSRDMIPNHVNEYKKLSSLLTDGRMAGIVDWSAIEDRVRVPKRPSQWDSVTSILESAHAQYRTDRMKGQANYIEVWIEKDALSGVLSRITKEYGINILVNRGYSSCSAMYDAYNRFNDALETDGFNQVKILYMGDFDPSGQDMIRDIEDRLLEFHKGSIDLEIIPLALTKKQIKEYNPPPNPAKMTDSRAGAYVAEHGYSSWEVDALPPNILNEILEEAIRNLVDPDLYETNKLKETEEKDKLKDFIDSFDNDEDTDDD